MTQITDQKAKENFIKARKEIAKRKANKAYAANSNAMALAFKKAKAK
jgi:hypothetical protein